jgi:hypothetical protein
MSCNEQQVKATTFLRSKPFRVGLYPCEPFHSLLETIYPFGPFGGGWG